MERKRSAFHDFLHRRDPTGRTEEETVRCLELHDAIVRNEPEAVERLVSNGMNVNSRLHFSNHSYAPDRTLISRDIVALPLHVACIYRRPKIVQVLLKCGADYNTKDYYGRTPIQLVIHYWPRLMHSFDYQNLTKADIEYQEYLKSQHEKCRLSLESLCSYGAVIDDSVNVDGETVVHLAAKFNIWRSIELLVDFGTTKVLETRDFYGNTPVLTASKYGRFEVLHEMLSRGAVVDVSENSGKNILHFAAYSDTTSHGAEIARLLRDERMSKKINSTDKNEDTALHIAARNGREAVVHALLEYGANPDLLNVQKVSPLFLLLDDVEHSQYICTIDKLINETTQVSIYSATRELPKLLHRAENESLRDYLVMSSTSPTSLQFISRQTIRRCLGRRGLNTPSIDQLSCPRKIKNYILLNNVKSIQC